MATSDQDPSADWARAVMVNDRTATGSLAAADAAVQIAMEAHQAVVVEVTGTWAGTITPEVSADGGTTWRVADFYDVTNKKIVATTTANGTFVILRAAGLSHARVRESAFTSGSATINIRATFAAYVYSESGGPNATALPPQGILIAGSDGTNLQFIRLAADNANALAVITTANLLRVVAENFAFNGTTWDRLASGADNSDAEAVVTLGALLAKMRMYLFNGTTWDRARTGVAQDSGLTAGIIAVHGARIANTPASTVAGQALASLQDLSLAGLRVVSAANTAVTTIIDTRNLKDSLAIYMATSAGTASVEVSGSNDNSNYLVIDTLAAAATVAKYYYNAQVGATIGICPLAFRYIKIVVAAAGAGNTTTTDIAVK